MEYLTERSRCWLVFRCEIFFNFAHFACNDAYKVSIFEYVSGDVYTQFVIIVRVR